VSGFAEMLNFDPVTNTLKPHSNRPLYNNTVIGTLAVDGWLGCYSWYSEEEHGRAAALPSPLLAVPNVTTHPSTASVPTSYYSLWHYFPLHYKGLIHRFYVKCSNAVFTVQGADMKLGTTCIYGKLYVEWFGF